MCFEILLQTDFVRSQINCIFEVWQILRYFETNIRNQKNTANQIKNTQKTHTKNTKKHTKNTQKKRKITQMKSESKNNKL